MILARLFRVHRKEVSCVRTANTECFDPEYPLRQSIPILSSVEGRCPLARTSGCPGARWEQRLAFRGRLRLRRARRQRTDAQRCRDMACTPRPVFLIPRWLRGPHLPHLPARPDVSPLPGRGGGGARLPGALYRLHVLGRSRPHVLTPPRTSASTAATSLQSRAGSMRST